MGSKILGISGSPVPNSNTDWAVKRILKHTGLEWHFVKLSDLNIEPCHACLSCAEGEQCAVSDDGWDLARLFHEARAFVIGGYTPFNSLDSRTKTFMERMYCLRQQGEGNRGKLGVSVIMTAHPPGAAELPPAAELAARQLDEWMAEEGIVNLGAMVILGQVLYIHSGQGDDCPMGGIRLLTPPAAEPENETDAGATPRVGELTKFDEAARILGERIHQAVLNLKPAKWREAV